MSKQIEIQNSKFKVQALKLFYYAGFLLLIAHCSLLNTSAQIAVRGETVWTMASNEPLRDGVVLISNGKIERVGAASSIQIPSNYRVINAKVVTPGLIDAHSTVGLSGYLNQPHDQSQLETSSAIQPELRAIDAYNPEERLIEWIRGFGVTTVHTGHGPGASVSGQTMIAKTVGKNVDAATIVPTAMIVATIGENGLFSGGRPPGTRAKEIAMLRNEFLKATDYNRKIEDAKGDAAKLPTRDLRTEMFAQILRREIPFLVTAHRHQDIVTSIRLAKEFNVRLVIDGAAEVQKVLTEVKASGFPVIIHPTMFRATGEAEHLNMENAAKLKQAGVLVALQSGFEAYVPKTRVVLFEAAAAAAHGLSFRDALATITIDAARIIGLDNRIGSLETGKDADIAMYDGDPFEYITHCTGTIINGQIVSEIIR
jgi:imidazolonepropionase-like amidohydrolase